MREVSLDSTTEATSAPLRQSTSLEAYPSFSCLFIQTVSLRSNLK